MANSGVHAYKHLHRLTWGSPFKPNIYGYTLCKTTYIAYTLGSTGYFGDIAPFENYLTTALKSARVSAGLEVSHTFKRHLTHRFNLNYLKII